MGWCSGADLADELWKTVVKFIPKDKRQDVAREWVDAFEGLDADTVRRETIVGETAYPSEDEDE